MTAILAVVLVAVIGFPSYSAPAFRVLVTLLAVVGAIGGVALFLGKSIGTLPAPSTSIAGRRSPRSSDARSREPRMAPSSSWRGRGRCAAPRAERPWA